MSANLLWEPSQSFRHGSNLWQYMEWLKSEYRIHFTDYSSLWKWSVDNPDEFWESLWKYFDIVHEGSYTSVMSPDEMPFVKWFDGTRLSYAEHVFRNFSEETPAIVFKSESSAVKTIRWEQLKSDTSALQSTLRDNGVEMGDTVAAYLPCIPEATVAFLATNSLGAIWSSCSPDFGTGAVIDRFAQIKPKVLIATDQYRYNGKAFSKTDVIESLVEAMPSIEQVIVIGEN